MFSIMTAQRLKTAHGLRPWPVGPWAIALAAAASFWAVQALGAEGSAGKAPSEAVFVAEVVALLLTGRLFGEVMLRLGQPAVVGQLLAGIVLGPSLFGLLAPGAHALMFPADHAQKAMIDGVAQLGVLLLLLLTGIETDVALVRRVGRAAAAVSLSGIAVPFVCGVGLGLTLLPDSLLASPDKRLITALFLGTALSISSIKIVAMVIDEMQFMRRNLGQIIVAAAVIDDTIGWILIAVTSGLARPEGLDVAHLVVSVGGTLAFLGFSATLGRRLVAVLMRWANDRLMSDLAVVTMVLVIMGLFALITHAIGVQTVLGAFVAGVLVGQSPILTKKTEQEIRGLVIALFAPIFFGLAGLGTDLTLLKDPTLLGLTAGLILVASVGKFGGAFVGGALGGLKRQESFALALGMNARGSTEVIVATIGLSIGAVTQTLFTMIVTMAVVTTTAMPPTLRWALARLPIGKDEAERLEREASEAAGFLGNVERLLLVRDEGASGRLAARLGGLLGGSRQIPITVLAGGSTTSDAEAEAAANAAPGHTGETHQAAGEADITLRPIEDVSEHEATAAEGRKGYGLLMIGVEPATRPEGGLHPRLARLAGSFEGVRAIVVARGPHRDSPSDGALQILVPTTGTAAGRRAAEVAFALARAERAAVTVLSIADPPTARQGRTVYPRPRGRAGQADILEDMEGLARQFDVQPQKAARIADDRTAAILGQARRAGDSLVVLEVEPRSSEAMPFGTIANGLLEGSEHSLLLVVAEGPITVHSKQDAGRS